MNTLIRGRKEALVASCTSWASTQRALFLRPTSPHTRCWDGIRGLLETLRFHRGDAAMDRVLSQHRLAAGLVPGVLHPSVALDDEERRSSRLLGAVPESHLTHNLLVQSTLFSSWAELLNGLLADLDGPLIVPNLADLDRESLAALRALYRQFSDSAPRLIAGYDPTTTPSSPDEHGLIWQDPAADAHRLGLAFATRAESEVVDLEAFMAKVGEKQSTSSNAVEERELAIDEQATRALSHESGELNAETCQRIVEAMRASFACFGFTTVLRLGLDLLAQSPNLNKEQHAEVHGLTALAAHNRQFRSNGNQALASFLEHHLTQALESETQKARRSCLCYRLAVTVGRRGKRFRMAKKWADRAIEEAQNAGLPAWQEAHLVAWARNIRAYLWMSLKQLDQAQEDCEAAFEQLDIEVRGRSLPAWRDPAPLVREMAYTHSLLADNLAALARLQDDDSGFARWKKLADEIAEAAPGLVRFEAILWIELYRSHLRFDLALEKARAGWRAAELEQDPLRVYNYLVQQADLHDRRGELGHSLERFQEAIDLRKRLGTPGILRSLEAIAGRVARQDGQLGLAQDYFEEALADCADLESQAILWADLGLVFATGGKEKEANERINGAIELAIESGDRDTLLEVSIRAGLSACQLHQFELALQAFEQALEIADTEQEIPPPAASIFLAHLHLIQLTGGSVAQHHLAAARELLPEALSDAETWAWIELLDSRIHALEAAPSGHLLRSAIAQRHPNSS